MGTFYPGMKVNPLDLSPNYAGSLMALTNGIGAMTGVAAPWMVGYMTPNVSFIYLRMRRMERRKNLYIYFFNLQSSLEEWRVVFWISFAIFVVTTFIYSIWASGEVQPWNEPRECKSSECGNAEYNNGNDKKQINLNTKH